MRYYGLILLVPLVVVGHAPGVSATTYCLIKATKDGFVALRERPDAGARLLQRMKAGDEVLPTDERQGPWVRVNHWAGGRFASGTTAKGDKPTARGWMHSRLIEKDSCG